MVRLLKIVVDSLQLDTYKAFLKEEIETSVKVGPGVLTLYKNGTMAMVKELQLIDTDPRMPALKIK